MLRPTDDATGPWRSPSYCSQIVTCWDLSLTAIDHDLPVGVDVIDRHVETTRHLGRCDTLSLDRPDVIPGNPQNKVTLSSCGSPVEEGFGSRWRSGDEGLNGESFPASTDHRVPEQAFYRTDVKHDMDGRYP